MAVTATTGTTTTTTATTTPATSAASDNKKNYETFLKMMTTQIKNQDPLNPMDSDQLAVQLATFSQVEQQTKTNDLLTQMVSQNTLGQMGQMVGWVGKEARVTAPVGFDGTNAVNVELAPRSGATKAILVAKDGAGTVVSQTEVAVQAGTYAWQGRDTDGNLLPKGSYTLSLTSLSATGELGSDTVTHYERVSEVRSGTSGVNLLLSNGTEVAASAVTAIREAVN
jgi:flagellar basal-body rod modification protein FlgD